MLLEWAKVLVVPVTVAIIGLIGSSWMNQRQSVEANDRLFAELISRREQADSDLRKEMFSLIINIFLGGSPSGMKVNVPTLEDPLLDNAKRELLALELLVYNFNESLDLGPLFKQVFEDIGKTDKTKDLEKRLTSLTREVIEKQVWALSSSAMTKHESNESSGEINFRELERMPQGVEIINVFNKTKSSNRNYRVWVLRHDEERKELQIQLKVKDNDTEVANRIFWVGQFDFPMLDNTRLPDGQRVSVVLSSWFPQIGAQIALVYFPGSYASLKEKPYYNEVLSDMLKGREKVMKY